MEVYIWYDSVKTAYLTFAEDAESAKRIILKHYESKVPAQNHMLYAILSCDPISRDIPELLVARDVKIFGVPQRTNLGLMVAGPDLELRIADCDYMYREDNQFWFETLRELEVFQAKIERWPGIRCYRL